MKAAAIIAAACLSVSLAACESRYPKGGLSQLGDPPPGLDDPPEGLSTPRTTWLALGRSYLQIGDLRLAKAAFIRSIRVEGVTAAALTGAGLAAEKQGLLNEARRFFELALDQAPSSEIAHNNLGAVQYRLGDFVGAKRSFQTAFAISSGTNKVAAHNLGLVELAIQRRAEVEVPITEHPLPLQREGSSEYRLLRADTKKEEVDG